MFWRRVCSSGRILFYLFIAPFLFLSFSSFLNDSFPSPTSAASWLPSPVPFAVLTLYQSLFPLSLTSQSMSSSPGTLLEPQPNLLFFSASKTRPSLLVQPVPLSLFQVLSNPLFSSLVLCVFLVTLANLSPPLTLSLLDSCFSLPSPWFFVLVSAKLVSAFSWSCFHTHTGSESSSHVRSVPTSCILLVL